MKAAKFCNIFGITPATLRTLAFRGELPFDDPRESGAYRVFDEDHVSKMQDMRELISFGIVAKTAAEIVRRNNGDAELMLRMLRVDIASEGMNRAEFAKAADISVPLLDYYISNDLLPFDDPKEMGKWRSFDAGHLSKLREMRELMSFGVTAGVASKMVRDEGPAAIVLEYLRRYA